MEVKMTKVVLVMLMGLMATMAQARPRSVQFQVDRTWEPTGRIEVRFVSEDGRSARISFTLRADETEELPVVQPSGKPAKSVVFIHRRIDVSYTGVQLTPEQLAEIRRLLVAHQLPMDTDHPLALYLRHHWFRSQSTGNTTYAFTVHERVAGRAPWHGQGQWFELK